MSIDNTNSRSSPRKLLMFQMLVVVQFVFILLLMSFQKRQITSELNADASILHPPLRVLPDALYRNNDTTVSFPEGFDPIDGANITWWSHYDGNHSQSITCYLGSDWKFLGHGMSHFAYVTKLACRQHDHGAGGASWRGQPRKVVVRLAIRTVEKLPMRKRNFRSVHQANLDQGRLFGQQVRGKWSESDIDSFFAIQKGQVDIPAKFLLDRLESVKDGNVVGVDLPEGYDNNSAINISSSFSIRADLSLVASGENLYTWLNPKSPKLHLATDQRLEVLQHMVLIYYHLFRQRLIHCDMHIGHLLVSVKNQNQDDSVAASRLSTKMVDFERVKFVNDPNDSVQKNSQEHNVRFQLWQLLGSMARVCAPNILENQYPIRAGICHMKNWTTPTEYASQILPELADCPFVQPLPWRILTQSSALQDDPYPFLSTIPTADIYKTLIELVGIRNHPLIQLDGI